jgi:hypothetical protein
MINSNLQTKIAEWINNESPAVAFNISVGSGTGTTTRGDTAMFSELTRFAATVDSSNTSLRFSRIIPGFTPAVAGKSLREVGVFDAASSGNLQSHTNNFAAITFSSSRQYIVRDYSYLDTGANLSKRQLTKKMMTSVIDYFKGSATGVPPTHIAFGTHLILDTCNATTGWTQGGQAAAPTTSTNFIEGTAALNLIKTGTAGTQSTYAKTITSVDGSKATSLKFNFRAGSNDTILKLTSANAIKVRIGSDSSNYIQYVFARSDFAVGWTLWDLPLASFTTTGTPVMSGLTYTYIEFNTNNNADTIAAEELIMDWWALRWDLATSDTTLHQEIIRKVVTSQTRDATNVTFNSLVATSEGNTYNYYYMSLFDAASTGDLYYVEETLPSVKDINTQINCQIQIGVKFNG